MGREIEGGMGGGEKRRDNEVNRQTRDRKQTRAKPEREAGEMETHRETGSGKY